MNTNSSNLENLVCVYRNEHKLFFIFYLEFFIGDNQNMGGIGLGLNLCKRLIGLLGPKSSFNVQTKLGIGTKFSFVVFSNLQ